MMKMRGRRSILVGLASTAIACAQESQVSGPAEIGDAAAPSLIDLGVSALSPADASPPLTLVPPFSSNVHDYYVRCAAGTNELAVSMTASPGAESVLLQPIPSHASPKQRISLRVKENQAIVAAATLGTATTEYWIRCLPHDFQPMEMSRHLEAGAVTPGYYLVGDEQANAAGVAYAMVVDGNGVPVWYYRQPQTDLLAGLSTGVFDVDVVVSGAISFVPWHSPGFLSPFEVHRLSPVKTTGVSGTGVALDPHELRLLSNGNFLLFTDQTESGVDLTGYPLKQPDGAAFGPNGSIVPCDIVEVDPAGSVVWRWVGTDHFDPVNDSTAPETANGPDGAPVADPFHCNSIDIDAQSGNLLISSRNMDSIFYIDRSSGKVLWKMGGTTHTKDGAPYIPVPDPFFRQHDARFQSGWSARCGGQGQISLFDDETSEPNTARAVVYDVNVGAGADSTAKCGTAGATLTWQRAGSAQSQFMGSFRILSDGSRIIGWGFGGQRGLVFTEVDVQGNDLLDFYFTDGSSSYRSIKVPLAALDLRAMRNTAGLSGESANDAGSDDGSGGSDATIGDATETADAGEIETGNVDSAGGTGCQVVSGSGSTRQCSYSSSCSSLAMATPGSCPSSGLYGCCVETQPADGGAESITATCYYSSAGAEDASAGCEFEAYQGMPYVWQTSAP